MKKEIFINESIGETRIAIQEDGQLSDNTINRIDLLYRNPVSGYAKQNNLLPGTWVNIHFGGDIPSVITGQITDLEEDMIEIITYPTVDKTIYIDFEYKGIPLNLPIEKIVIREKPASLKSNASLSLLKDDTVSSEESPETDASIEFIDDGESVVKVSEDEKPDPIIPIFFFINNFYILLICFAKLFKLVDFEIMSSPQLEM